MINEFIDDWGGFMSLFLLQEWIILSEKKDIGLKKFVYPTLFPVMKSFNNVHILLAIKVFVIYLEWGTSLAHYNFKTNHTSSGLYYTSTFNIIIPIVCKKINEYR